MKLSWLLLEKPKTQVNIVELKECVHTDVFRDLAQLRIHVKGWLPHYKFLGDELGSCFLDELIDEYVSQYSIQDDSKIKLPDCYLEVVITKY